MQRAMVAPELPHQHLSVWFVADTLYLQGIILSSLNASGPNQTHTNFIPISH